MVEISLKENIDKLKKQFENEDPSALHQINEWEREIIRLTNIEKFSKFPATIALVSTLKERLRSVITIRATATITHEEMNCYDARRSELKYILNLLLPDFENELEEINRQVINELSE